MGEICYDELVKMPKIARDEEELEALKGLLDLVRIGKVRAFLRDDGEILYQAILPITSFMGSTK
jgi:hypothetical protein